MRYFLFWISIGAFGSFFMYAFDKRGNRTKINEYRESVLIPPFIFFICSLLFYGQIGIVAYIKRLIWSPFRAFAWNKRMSILALKLKEQYPKDSIEELTLKGRLMLERLYRIKEIRFNRHDMERIENIKKYRSN